jgi:DNA-binding response OmpR family regulator
MRCRRDGSCRTTRRNDSRLTPAEVTLTDLLLLFLNHPFSRVALLANCKQFEMHQFDTCGVQRSRSGGYH